MQPPKLSDENAIQLLSEGISSIAIRAAAASLKVDSISKIPDEFLRDMQHVTTSCNNIFKKSSSISPKKNKFKEDSSSPENSNHREKKEPILYILPR